MDLTFTQGDTFLLNLAIADATGSYLNISGTMFAGKAKYAYTDPTASWYFTCSVQVPGVISNIAPSSGSVAISIHASSSAQITASNYVYDVIWIDTTSTQRTVLSGNATVVPSVFG